ncbi:hypothetical protein WJX72_005727 [[Myrmecia] bisecta]|uniref:Aspartate aminotransferase n=1 Tax=[Myrmecia] bisecta TaxID=41462 RepID=A0AAW1PLJ6_9CHLO
MTSLQSLACTVWAAPRFPREEIDVPGFAQLSRLSGLTALCLRLDAWTNGTAQLWADSALPSITALRSLELAWTPEGGLTEKDMAHIARFTGLHRLHISQSIDKDHEFGDAGLLHLAGLHGLTSLVLWCCPGITKHGIGYLTALRGLRELGWLRSTADFAGLSALTGLHLPTSFWSDVPQAPLDPIIGVWADGRADTDPRTLNLTAGAYRTEEGKPYLLEAVRRAERMLLDDPTQHKEYRGMKGDPELCRVSAQMAFGEESDVLLRHRNATVQGISGTGSLMVGAHFLSHHQSVKLLLVSSPTWANHHSIFSGAGFKLQPYRYYSPATHLLDYEGMIEDLSAAPEGAVVLLHACAHNPTGVDPSLEQWHGVLRVVRQRRLLPFFDSAYQGFASGSLEQDAAAIRLFADAGLEMLLAQSYAKNMGLYNERAGALTVVCADAEAVKRVESQLHEVIRPIYSDPPAHGAAIVTTIMKSPELYGLWKEELVVMSSRVALMRQHLYQALVDLAVPGDWTHILKQIGMFSYTGLTKEQAVEIVNQAKSFTKRIFEWTDTSSGKGAIDQEQFFKATSAQYLYYRQHLGASSQLPIPQSIDRYLSFMRDRITEELAFINGSSLYTVISQGGGMLTNPAGP